MISYAAAAPDPSTCIPPIGILEFLHDLFGQAALLGLITALCSAFWLYKAVSYRSRQLATRTLAVSLLVLVITGLAWIFLDPTC